eukprot:4390476-Ditylum_brightwellii.AAC.1
MAPDISFFAMSSQFDLILAIDRAINDGPLTWHWCHIKGHQDKHYGPLDQWASLNVECNHAAKNRCAHDISHPQPHQETIEGEYWMLF